MSSSVTTVASSTSAASSGLSVGGIIAIVVIVLLLLALLAGGGYGYYVWRQRRNEKKKYQKIYDHWNKRNGYEFGTLIYQPNPYLDDDLTPLFYQIFYKGLMRYNVIQWRQKLLENSKDRMQYFADRYPYNDMTFYSNTYYLKLPGTFDRLYEKLKKMILEQKQKMEGQTVIPIQLTGQPRIREYPEQMNNIHMLHIGSNETEKIYTEGDRSITIKQNCGLQHSPEFMKILKKINDMPTRPPPVSGGGFSSSLITVTLTDKKTNERLELDYMELTEVKVPSPMFGKFSLAMHIPWFHLAYLANRYKAVILIDGNEYFVAMNMILNTLNILLNPNWAENHNNDNLIELGEGLYYRFKELYNPKSDPIEPWLLWLHALSEYYYWSLPVPDKRDHEACELRYSVDRYGDLDVAILDIARSRRRATASSIIWHKTEFIPVKGEYVEKIKTELEEPCPDLKYAAEYVPDEPNDDVLKKLKKNPNGGRVEIPPASPRLLFSTYNWRESEKRRESKMKKQQQPGEAGGGEPATASAKSAPVTPAVSAKKSATNATPSDGKTPEQPKDKKNSSSKSKSKSLVEKKSGIVIY